jgi:hypothetical protein
MRPVSATIPASRLRGANTLGSCPQPVQLITLAAPGRVDRRRSAKPRLIRRFRSASPFVLRSKLDRRGRHRPAFASHGDAHKLGDGAHGLPLSEWRAEGDRWRTGTEGRRNGSTPCGEPGLVPGAGRQAIKADPQRPALAETLDVEPTDGGVVTVLIENIRLDDALVGFAVVGVPRPSQSANHYSGEGDGRRSSRRSLFGTRSG